jgi:hypothetical protein
MFKAGALASFRIKALKKIYKIKINLKYFVRGLTSEILSRPYWNLSLR